MTKDPFQILADELKKTPSIVGAEAFAAGRYAEGAKLFDGEQEIGVVTSGGFAPSVGAPIAMGYVPRDHAVPGTALAAEVRGKRVPCTVAAMPFVPHRYVRKQGG